MHNEVWVHTETCLFSCHGYIILYIYIYIYSMYNIYIYIIRILFLPCRPLSTFNRVSWLSGVSIPIGRVRAAHGIPGLLSAAGHLHVQLRRSLGQLQEVPGSNGSAPSAPVQLMHMCQDLHGIVGSEILLKPPRTNSSRNQACGVGERNTCVVLTHDS